MKNHERLNDRIVSLANRIANNWTLCEFAGKTEAEFMVAQTIHAAKINLDQRGHACSFQGVGCHSYGGGGLVDNGTGYGILLSRGWIQEELVAVDDPRFQPIPENLAKNSNGQVTVMWPTEQLVLDLEAFLHRQDQKCGCC